MPSVIIRKATSADIPALVQLTKELGYPDTEEEIQRRFNILSALRAHEVIVAEINEAVIGLMSFFALDILYGDGKLGLITALVVAESARGKGIGKLLVNKAEELALEYGCKKIELTSNNKRVSAHKFYQTLGYEATSKRFVKKL
jgi:GNAT superfamily N-acetyltransferase